MGETTRVEVDKGEREGEHACARRHDGLRARACSRTRAAVGEGDGRGGQEGGASGRAGEYERERVVGETAR